MKKLEQIKNSIQEFLRGGDTNDAALLDKVLHADFRNTQDGFFDKKGIYTFSKAEYIDLVASKRFGGSPRTVEFVSVDDLGNMAVAKVLLEWRVRRCGLRRISLPYRMVRSGGW